MDHGHQIWTDLMAFVQMIVGNSSSGTSHITVTYLEDDFDKPMYLQLWVTFVHQIGASGTPLKQKSLEHSYQVLVISLLFNHVIFINLILSLNPNLMVTFDSSNLNLMFLNLNLIYETLQTEAGSGLLVSMLEKLNLFFD